MKKKKEVLDRKRIKLKFALREAPGPRPGILRVSRVESFSHVRVRDRGEDPFFIS